MVRGYLEGGVTCYFASPGARPVEGLMNPSAADPGDVMRPAPDPQPFPLAQYLMMAFSPSASHSCSRTNRNLDRCRVWDRETGAVGDAPLVRRHHPQARRTSRNGCRCQRRYERAWGM